MQMRFLSKLSLFLVFLTFPHFLPPSSKSIFCPLLAWSAEIREYGSDGRNGSDGRTGQRGRDGQSQTIFVDGSPLNLDLSGEDGSSGEDGLSGGNADYRTRYEGNIPAELVSRSNNRFTLNLGKLPIESEFLRPGVAVEIELVATRSFAGRSTEQKIEWRGQIRR